MCRCYKWRWIVKVDQMKGATLDLCVAMAEGIDAILSDPYPNGTIGCITYYCRSENGRMDGRSYKPSEHWGDGGPILGRERFVIDGHSLRRGGFHVRHVTEKISKRGNQSYVSKYGFGETLLLAAMRAFVKSKFGDEIATGAE